MPLPKPPPPAKGKSIGKSSYDPNAKLTAVAASEDALPQPEPEA